MMGTASRQSSRLYGALEFPVHRESALHEESIFQRGSAIEPGSIRYLKSRDVLGALRDVTLSQPTCEWFVLIHRGCEFDEPVPQTPGTIGIDVGIARVVTLGDGVRFTRWRCKSFAKQWSTVGQKIDC
ncbi:hypothetical protein [Paraburkholderia heleia]|uniref:hypothetical protein n=1 Tax=Paraburkholderia heleia TaxID=634127 RepID=UPI0031D1AD58